MNVNYLRQGPFKFSQLSAGQCFQLEDRSKLFIKMEPPDTAGLDLETGQVIELDMFEDIIPCPDAMIVRKS